jgi:hypothetical protein
VSPATFGRGRYEQINYKGDNPQPWRPDSRASTKPRVLQDGSGHAAIRDNYVSDAAMRLRLTK